MAIYFQAGAFPSTRAVWKPTNDRLSKLNGLVMERLRGLSYVPSFAGCPLQMTRRSSVLWQRLLPDPTMSVNHRINLWPMDTDTLA